MSVRSSTTSSESETEIKQLLEKCHLLRLSLKHSIDELLECVRTLEEPEVKSATIKSQGDSLS